MHLETCQPLHPEVVIFGTVCATAGLATPYQDQELSHVVLHTEYFDGHGFQRVS